MLGMAALMLIIGFVILIKSADLLVNGASSLAKKISISEMAIGLTIVAFGTSAPELIVNVISSTGGHNDLCYGNVVGSNIFNTLVVLGFAGIIHPIMVQKNTVKKEIPMVFVGTIFLLGLSNNFGFGGHVLSRIDGLLLVISLIVFIFYVTTISKDTSPNEFDIHVFSLPKSIIFILVGIMGLFFGGEMVVKNAVFAAQLLKVSEKFIGITIVALGTSLPELVTSIIAVTKKRYGLAVGNVIGSNLFNIFMVLGLTAIINPVVYPTAMNIDMVFLMLVTLILFITMFTGKRHQLDRWEAAIFLALYVGYVIFLFNRM